MGLTAAYVVQTLFGTLGGQVGSGTGILADENDSTYVTVEGNDPLDWPDTLDEGNESGEFYVTFTAGTLTVGQVLTVRGRVRARDLEAGGTITVTVHFYSNADPDGEPTGLETFPEVVDLVPTSEDWQWVEEAVVVSAAMSTAAAAGTLRSYTSVVRSDLAQLFADPVPNIRSSTNPARLRWGGLG